MRSQVGRIPRLVWLFVLLVLPVCLFQAIAIPFAEVPDEHTHILRAASLLWGEVIGHRQAATGYAGEPIQVAGFDIDPALTIVGREMAYASAPVENKKVDATLLVHLHATPWTGAAGFAATSNMAVYPPVFYLASAAGLGLARAAGLLPFTALLAGRLANAVAYVALAALALGLARRGRLLLFSVLALPMTLWVAPSFSQDGLILATMALAVALLTRAMEAESNRGPDYWIAAVALGCVILAKPPYLPLAAMLLVPVRAGQRGILVRRAAGLLVAICPVLIWTWASSRLAAVPFPREAYAPGPLFPGDHATLLRQVAPGLQLAVFRAHPSAALLLPLRTFATDAGGQWRMMLGVLGTLDVLLPPRLYALWSAALAAAVASVLLTPFPARWHPGYGLLLMAALVASVIGLYDVLYMTWTNVGAVRIEGVQGRYFLPMVPVLALAMPGLRLPGWRPLVLFCAALPVLAASVDLVFLPQLVLRTYYLR